MSINIMFKDFQNRAKTGDILNSLIILKNIWLKYPRNKRIIEEKVKLKKKFIPRLKTVLNQGSLQHFFESYQKGNTSVVINDLKLIIRNNPDDFLALNLLGSFYGQSHNYNEAIELQKISITINPFDPNNYLNLALSLEKNGDLNKALAFLEIGKFLDNENIDINKCLGKLYYFLRKFSLSLNTYEDLIKIDDDIEIKINYMRSLIEAKRVNEALKILEKLKNNKTHEDRLSAIEGLAYLRLKNFEKAKKIIKLSLIENPDNSDAFNILGSIYESLGLMYKAITNYEKATKIDNRNYIAFNNLGACYSFIGEVNLSITYFKKSIEINPFFYDGIYRLAQMQIYNQNFKEGWQNFKFRWRSSHYAHKYLKTSKPILEDLENSEIKILAWNEQGLGDQVMYGSMFKELSDYTKQLTIRLDKRLIKVFQNTHPNINFTSVEDIIDEKNYDKHIPFGHLGSFFRIKKKSFQSSKIPYISGDRTTQNYINRKYRSPGKLLVGISWSSSNHLLSESKSLSLETLYPILSLKNINFIDLNSKDSLEETMAFFNNHNIKILKDESIDNFNDIEGLCSIIQACDFIVSCSNTNAHLAGALFKKTYLLLAKGKGRLWNWNSNNNFSIWYPKTKIFEQKDVGDWAGPINNLRKEISNEQICV